MDEWMKQQIDALEQAVREQTEAHEALLSLLEQKRAALRDADDERMTQLCALENEKLRAIGESEKKRAELAAALTLHVQPDAQAPLRLNELAERLPEPARGRLLVLRQRLRERMQQVQQASTVTRRATETLATHVQGLVQTIGMLATGVSTYDGKGARPAEATTMRTINVTA